MMDAKRKFKNYSRELSMITGISFRLILETNATVLQIGREEASRDVFTESIHPVSHVL